MSRTNTALPSDLYKRFSLMATVLGYNPLTSATQEAITAWMNRNKSKLAAKFPDVARQVFPLSGTSNT